MTSHIQPNPTKLCLSKRKNVFEFWPRRVWQISSAVDGEATGVGVIAGSGRVCHDVLEQGSVLEKH